MLILFNGEEHDKISGAIRILLSARFRNFLLRAPLRDVKILVHRRGCIV